ncbi:MAG: hypothetical protein KBF75_05990 [Saprospiraceae bacterium]|nr:hypothetical protein [Saprospiraceae bacterium]
MNNLIHRVNMRAGSILRNPSIRSWKIYIFLILMNICLGGNTSAQVVYPVDVTANMIVGGSVYLGDFANPLVTANRLQYTITLRDPVETERTVYFRLKVRQNGSIIGVNLNGFRGNEVTLHRNEPLTITGEDLATNLANLNGLSGNGTYGVLNEGITDICLEVIDSYKDEVISREACASGYLARLQAPILLLPVEGQNIFESQLNNIVFSWQMTDPLAQLPFVNIRYLFELREKSPLLDPNDQFENHTLVYSTTIDHFSVFYNELTSQLEPSKIYIWRVTAQFFDETGTQIPNYFVHNGISRVGLFQVLPDFIPGENQSGVSCQCPEGECDFMLQDLIPSGQGLQVGDSVRFGAFNMTISDLDNSGQSGSGSVTIPFLNTAVEVSFDHISINAKREVISGSLSVEESQLISGITTDADLLPDLSGISIGADWLTEMNQHVREIKEQMSLPISLGNTLAMLGFSMPFEIYVTAIDFNLYGSATASLLLSIPGANGQIFNFGASGVRIGRSGFDMADLRLYLLNDVTIPGLSSVPLVLHRAVGNQPGTGSYIYFDCDGFKEFNIQASYQFPQEQLISAEDNVSPVIATLTLNSTNWGQFTGHGEMTPFVAASAPGWVFSPGQVVIDMDLNNNPETIAFPENYAAVDNSWRGFYIDNVSVQLPEDMQLSKSGPTVFAAHNIILDASGVTGLLEGHNLIDLSTGDAGGWAFSIDSIALNVLQNSFVDAHIAGKAGVSLLDAELGYQGILARDEHGNYAFNLSPQGTFGIPFLKLNAEIENGSVLAIEKQANGKYRPYIDLSLNVNMQVPESDFRDEGLGDIIDQLKGVLGISEFKFGLSGLKLNHLLVNHPSLPPGKYFSLEGTEGGVIQIPGLPEMQLSELSLLEQNNVFKGMSLPALGLDMQLNMGFLSMGVGVWAKKDTTKPGSKYSFGKFELALPDLSGLSFKCQCDSTNSQDTVSGFNYCDPPNLSGGSPVSIEPGDVVQVGHFKMAVDEITGTNSGKGKIMLPFLRMNLEVSFDNIIVAGMPSGEKRLINGVVLSAANASMGGFSVDVSNDEGPLDLSGLNNTDGFMSQMDDLASQAGQFFSMPFSIRDKMNTLFGVTLPEGFDFILLGIRFEPDRARLSAMLTFKVQEANYLKFGLTGVNIRPDGFNMDGLQIYLSEDFTSNK